MLRYLSGGESHGACLLGIIEGLPSGLSLTASYINQQLARRQQGYGRGGRMRIEKDRVEFLSGVRFNRSLGSPLTLKIENQDSKNWQEVMQPEGERKAEVASLTLPRPGHADLAGGIKYQCQDLRDILERASARETAMRVAVGSVAQRLLEELGIEVFAHVVSIGEVRAKIESISLEKMKERRDGSSLFCVDSEVEASMKTVIDQARQEGDTVGGVIELVVTGIPPGLGSHVHWDRKLDGRLSGALMSLQGIKGVEIGLGFESSFQRGSRVHDPIYYSDQKGVHRQTNNAGGIEGGISNGEPLVLRAAMKPIPTLLSPLPSVDINTLQQTKASVERSDICAVPAASVVAEKIVAWEVAVAIKENFGGDSLEGLLNNYRSFLQNTKKYLKGTFKKSEGRNT